jgi:ubiquitin-like 1-activating enzyme E1 B
LFDKEIRNLNESTNDKNRVPLEYLEEYLPADLDEQIVPNLPQAASLFIFSANSLIESPSRGQMVFDKDNALIVKFISSASNLRSYNFGIEPLSIFQAKQIAGNIIPAVATTNAIAASLQVIEGLKILQGIKDYKNSWILQSVSSNKLIVSGRMPQPKPNCYACSSSISHISLSVNLTTFTMNDLVKLVLIQQLSMKEPSISLNASILYESGEGLDEDDISHYITRGKLNLQDLGIHHGSVLECDVRVI